MTPKEALDLFKESSMISADILEEVWTQRIGKRSFSTLDKIVDSTVIEQAKQIQANSPDPDSITLGELINNRYILRSLLDRALNGTVYIARDTRVGNTVALKFLNTSSIENFGILTEFLKAPGKIVHSEPIGNSVLDRGIHNSSPYYVMPLLPGENLEKLLDRTEQWEDPAWAMSLAEQVIGDDAIAVAAGFFSRDVVPRNLVYHIYKAIQRTQGWPVDGDSSAVINLETGELVGQTYEEMYQVRALFQERDPSIYGIQDFMDRQINGLGCLTKGWHTVIIPFFERSHIKTGLMREIAAKIAPPKGGTEEEIRANLLPNRYMGPEAIAELHYDIGKVKRQLEGAIGRRKFFSTVGKPAAAAAIIGGVLVAPYINRIVGERLERYENAQRFNAAKERYLATNPSDIATMRLVRQELHEAISEQVIYIGETAARIPSDEAHIPAYTKSRDEWVYSRGQNQYDGHLISALIQAGNLDLAVQFAERQRTGKQRSGDLYSRFGDFVSLASKTGNNNFQETAELQAASFFDHFVDPETGAFTSGASGHIRFSVSTVTLNPLLAAVTRSTRNHKYLNASLDNLRNLRRYNLREQGVIPELIGSVREDVLTKNGEVENTPYRSYIDEDLGKDFSLYAAHQGLFANAFLSSAFNDMIDPTTREEFTRTAMLSGIYLLEHSDEGLYHYGIIDKNSPIDNLATTYAYNFAKRASDQNLDLSAFSNIFEIFGLEPSNDYFVRKAIESERALIQGNYLHPLHEHVGILTGSCIQIDGASPYKNIQVGLNTEAGTMKAIDALLNGLQLSLALPSSYSI